MAVCGVRFVEKTANFTECKLFEFNNNADSIQTESV